MFVVVRRNLERPLELTAIVIAWHCRASTVVRGGFDGTRNVGQNQQRQDDQQPEHTQNVFWRLGEHQRTTVAKPADISLGRNAADEAYHEFVEAEGYRSLVALVREGLDIPVPRIAAESAADGAFNAWGEIVSRARTVHTKRFIVSDGATDDAIALPRPAFDVTPEAETSRGCVFDRSRGGTVALFTGIRERRVDRGVLGCQPQPAVRRFVVATLPQPTYVRANLSSESIHRGRSGSEVERADHGQVPGSSARRIDRLLGGV